MYRSGLSSGEIAEICNVALMTVIGCLRRLGEPRRSADEAARVRVANGRGKTASYWLGKTQPPEMVEKRISKIRGEAHYLWKGGKTRRGYRHAVEKEVCAKCGAVTNLAIHHENLDHYDDEPANLQVLCVSCHASVHKQAYWDAVHAGVTPSRSNGPIGWRKKEGDAGVGDS